MEFLDDRITMKTICFNSSMVFTDTHFVGNLSKATSKNISVQLTESNYIFPIISSGVFRIQSNIFDGAFFQK